MHTTSIIDSAANVKLLDDLVSANTADSQLGNKIIMQPKGNKMKSQETLHSLLNKIPEPRR